MDCFMTFTTYIIQKMVPSASWNNDQSSHLICSLSEHQGLALARPPAENVHLSRPAPADTSLPQPDHENMSVSLSEPENIVPPPAEIGGVCDEHILVDRSSIHFSFRIVP